MHSIRLVSVIAAMLVSSLVRATEPAAEARPAHQKAQKVTRVEQGPKHCFVTDPATGRMVPAPAGTLGPQALLYCSIIEAQAQAIESNAVDRMNTALKAAFERGAYGDAVLSAEAVLSEFRPELGAPVHELPLIASDGFVRAH
jgi:hypothetical protein